MTGVQTCALPIWPATFTRQLTATQRAISQYMGAISLGDSWRRSPDVQIQYGLRLENTRFGQSPLFNADVEQTFGRRNNRIPTPIALSPRIGFSWTLGTSNDIAAFTGAFRAPRAVVRGGIGVFTNSSQSGTVGSAIDNTGLASGVQQLVCTGDAVPVPN